MISPYDGMFGLTIFDIRSVMNSCSVVSSLLLGIGLPARLVLSVRIGISLALGSTILSTFLMAGPLLFITEYLPVIGLWLFMPCFIVGWWQLNGMGSLRLQIRMGVRWWWMLGSKPRWRA
ncbi:hypothetical protein [Halomonas piscis]|uniref:hypothetical protein n=1 Tax=Halomonas piscis TaxID=3031727 RepID=UPI00289C86EA|nr:hypothetical protein [Halomonas piscis]